MSDEEQRVEVRWTLPPPSEDFLMWDLEKSISETFEGVGIYPTSERVSDIRKKLIALMQQRPASDE